MAYPATGADLKGLMKSAYYDPNPVVILEHKGLYWSKIKGTENAKTIEPSEDYVIPFGKARITKTRHKGNKYNLLLPMEWVVYWAMNAAKDHNGKVEVVDLRNYLPN